ncbi:MAG: PRC-barrel domain-containing protein, partial [Nanoarchaeota archaeon]|nr:PRC-barrel domain-containing protein [Nanoarchaeota archaeon]
MDAVVERQVYSEDGIRIGKVVDVVLLNSMVYGWLVKLSGKYECDKKVLIKKKNVKVVSDILIVDKDVEEHLKKFEKGRIYSILRALHLVKSKEEIAEIKLKEKIRIQSAAAEQRKIENE